MTRRPRDLTPYLRMLAAGVAGFLAAAFLADLYGSLVGVAVFGAGTFVWIGACFVAMWRDSDL